jgi:neutral ceramidase
MFAAWQAAGAHLSRRPALDLRWTVSCFCGRETATGKVDTKGQEGIGFLTGSEEGRGPLYDVTQTPLEGQTSPVDDPVQGDKIVFPAGSPAPAVPVGVFRVGDGVLLGVPGEATKEVGTRMRAAAMQALTGTGITHAAIAGLADDYIQYITTPEEYGQQSYEGASTLFGKSEATFLQERLAELATAMKAGQPAPAPYDVDPSYGVHPDGPAYDGGASSGQITTQPQSSTPGGTVDLALSGGPSGTDRPVDRAFVIVEHRTKGRWVVTDVDTGLDMFWRCDDQGHYTLQWSVRGDSIPGTYRIRVAATKYTLTTQTFTLG